MQFSLTEIQITSVILIGLFTLVIAFLVPHYTKNVRIFVITRRFLIIGMILAAAHFLIQYIFHKNFIPDASIRTLINVLFGFPTSYFFTLTLLFLVRRGNLKKIEWLFLPVVYVIALLTLVVSLILKVSIVHILPVIASFYAITLIYGSYLLIQSFVRLRSSLLKGDHSYDLLRKWTQWSLLLISLVGLGFPFVIFSSDVMVRSIYGLITISVTFIFILGVLGYFLNYNVMAGMKEKQEMENAAIPPSLDIINNNRTAHIKKKEVRNTGNTDVSEQNTPEDDKMQPLITIDEARMAKITAATQKFINEKRFTSPGLSLKEAASEMGVPVYLLRNWLRTTEYVKYNNWIIALRIEYAKKLLSEDPSLTNEVVSFQCGFCDRQYFQAQFTKIVGVTPFKWVKGINNDTPI